MENPLEAFGKLNDKQKLMVGVGAVGVGGFLWWHSKNAADSPAPTDESTAQQSSSSGIDDGGSSAIDPGYGGGGGGGYNPGTPSPAPTSSNDGTTPETPIVNVAAPDMTGVADAIREVGEFNNVSNLDTGGGAPVTDPAKHAEPKKASSFTLKTIINKKTGTTQTVHDYAGSHPDVVTGSHKTTAAEKRAAAPKKAPVKKAPAKKKAAAKKHVNHK